MPVSVHHTGTGEPLEEVTLGPQLSLLRTVDAATSKDIMRIDHSAKTPLGPCPTETIGVTVVGPYTCR